MSSLPSSASPVFIFLLVVVNHRIFAVCIYDSIFRQAFLFINHCFLERRVANIPLVCVLSFHCPTAFVVNGQLDAPIVHAL